MTLHVIFHEWKAAAEILVEAGDARTTLTGLFCMVRFTFLEALFVSRLHNLRLRGYQRGSGSQRVFEQ